MEKNLSLGRHLTTMCVISNTTNLTWAKVGEYSILIRGKDKKRTSARWKRSDVIMLKKHHPDLSHLIVFSYNAKQ